MLYAIQIINHANTIISVLKNFCDKGNFEDARLKENQMDEMRRFKRINVSFSVLYKVNAPLTVRMQVGDKEFDAEALDLSEEGIAILAKYKKYAIPVFTIVSVKFTMLNRAAVDENRYRSIEVKGEVRSSLFMKEKGTYRFGIHFLNISTDERAFINDFVRRK